MRIVIFISSGYSSGVLCFTASAPTLLAVKFTVAVIILVTSIGVRRVAVLLSFRNFTTRCAILFFLLATLFCLSSLVSDLPSSVYLRAAPLPGLVETNTFFLFSTLLSMRRLLP